MRRYTCFLLPFLLFVLNSFSQKNLAEKLGYPGNSKLLIIHADDVGLSHSVDSAVIGAFEKHGINSASIMVPCPWFPEIAAYAKQHPELDFGLHLTFTAEWKNYKWDGVVNSAEIKSLLNDEGYMYSSVEEFARHALPAEVEKEMEGQIKKAQQFGINVTHLDNHMGSILISPEMMKVYVGMGKKYRLPVLVPISFIKLAAPELQKYIDTTGLIVVENFVMASPEIPTAQWDEFYNNAILNLKPGLNELVVHLSFDNAEMNAITIDHPDYGAAWRQRDFNYVTSEKFKYLLKENNIKLVTWREIKKVMYGD